MRRRGRRRTLTVGLALTLAAGVASACSSSSGPPTITWFYNPDSGGQVLIAKQCQAASHGAYQLQMQELPSDASLQRQNLVTRLSAQDSGIGIMSLDPVFVAEFAEAGFLADVPKQYQAEFTQDIVKPSVQSSMWQDKMVAAPFWANTQLLWYRKSLAKQAGLDMSKPVTWDQIIDAAAKIPDKTVGVQAKLYEGYTVWINALVEGAGGQILDNPGALAKNVKLGLDTPAGRDAAAVIQKLVQAHVGGPSLSSNDEAASLSLFEADKTSMFMAIWPYVWGAMASDKVKFRDSDVGWTFYPETVAGKESRPPFGGIDLAVSKYSDNQPLAWKAIECIRTEQHQLQYMASSSNPAANTKVYTDPTKFPDPANPKKMTTIQGEFPMANLIEQSLERAAPRPQTQYYGDLSTALQEQFSPPNSVSQSTPKDASDFILQVLKGEKLL